MKLLNNRLVLRNMKRYTFRWVLIIVSLLSIVLITFTVYRNFEGSIQNLDPFRTGKAAFIPFANGQVSIDQVFLSGSNEVQNIVVSPNSQFTVRLKYNNTGNLKAENTRISAIAPAGFSFVSGSASNNIKNLHSVGLDNTIFNSLNNEFLVSPSAGFYGFPNNSTVGVLDIGRKRFIRVPRCSPHTEIFTQAANNTAYTQYDPATNICSNITGGAFQIAYDIELDTVRYVKMVECQMPSGESEIFAQYSSNQIASSAFDSTGTSCPQTVAGTFESVLDLDILSGRYLRVQRCSHDNPTGYELFAQRFTDSLLQPDESTGNTCSQFLTGSSFLNGYNIDILDTQRGYGHIELLLTAPSTSGCYRMPVSMSSDDFELLTEEGGSCDIKVQSQTSFSGGVISHEKVYWNGMSEVNFVEVSPGGEITIRLKYDNSSSQTGESARISDTFDTSQFTFIDGSAKNCLIDNQSCVPLQNSSFINGSVNLSPSAGWYGESETANSGVLNIGNSRYITVIHCSNGTHTDHFTVNASNSNSGLTGTCADNGLSGYLKTGEHVVDLFGRRYANTIICERNGYTNTFIASASNSTGPSTASCGDFGLTDYQKIGGYEVDLRNSLYLNTKQCEKDGLTDIAVLEATREEGQAGLTCSLRGITGYSDDGGVSVRFDDNNRGRGFIEYTIEAGLNARLGLHGTNSTLTSLTNSFSSVSGFAVETILIELYCDSINPEGNIREISLTDAELRTDQDFTCNFDAKICPVVFSDDDLDGQRSELETIYSGIVVELRRTRNNDLVRTITTNDQSQVCFNGLATGEVYNVTVTNPPNVYSTTGGDVVTIESSLLQSEQFVNFGYGLGGVTLIVSDQANFPPITTANVDTVVETVIPRVEVRELGQVEAWTVSATWSNFVPLNDQVPTLTISNRLTPTPQTVSALRGSVDDILPGQRRLVNSTEQQIDIYARQRPTQNGNYTSSVRVEYSVPSFTRPASYQSTATFTLLY